MLPRSISCAAVHNRDDTCIIANKPGIAQIFLARSKPNAAALLTPGVGENPRGRRKPTVSGSNTFVC